MHGINIPAISVVTDTDFDVVRSICLFVVFKNFSTECGHCSKNLATNAVTQCNTTVTQIREV
jgi:hypothetical protein